MSVIQRWLLSSPLHRVASKRRLLLDGEVVAYQPREDGSVVVIGPAEASWGSLVGSAVDVRLRGRSVRMRASAVPEDARDQLVQDHLIHSPRDWTLLGVPVTGSADDMAEAAGSMTLLRLEPTG